LFSLHRRLSAARKTSIDVRLTDEWPTEAHIRYLEMIQSIVGRMGTNSFLAKGWALTVAGAIYGFAATHLNSWISLAGLASTLGFWWLDAYYLRSERLFRSLYHEACAPNASVSIFSLDITKYKKSHGATWPRIVFSATLFIFYGAIFLVGTGFAVASMMHDGS
jgi:hypothetical protein